MQSYRALSTWSSADFKIFQTGVEEADGHFDRPVYTAVFQCVCLFVLCSCRPLPPVQHMQREARQATFLFRRGLKVLKVNPRL